MKSTGLAMIVKNSAETLDVCLASTVGLFQQVVIVDTGSTDNTKDICQKYGVELYDFVWQDDFSAARNFSFSKLKTEYGFWLDDDDCVIGQENFNHMVQRMEEEKLDAVGLEYYYSFDAAGQQRMAEMMASILNREIKLGDVVSALYPRVTTTQLRERLIDLSQPWPWLYRVHEALPVAGKRIGKYDGVKILHRRHVKKNATHGDRNLRILESYPEYMRDQRVVFYLGLEYAFHNRIDDSIAAFQKYLPMSTIPEEQYMANHFLADLYRAKGRYEDAELSDLHAVAIRPTWRDAYAGLLSSAVAKQDWDKAKHWIGQVKASVIPDTPFAFNPLHEQIGWVPDYVRTLVAEGNYEAALVEVQNASRVTPENVSILAEVDALSAAINAQRGAASIADTLEFFLRQDDAESAAMIIARLHPQFRTYPEIASAVKSVGQLCGRAARGEITPDVYIDHATFGFMYYTQKVQGRPHAGLQRPDRRWVWLAERLAYINAKSVLIVGGPPALHSDFDSIRIDQTFHINGIQGEYDAVVLWNCLERVSRPDLVVEKALAAILPGGWLYTFVPNGPTTKGLAPSAPERLRLRAYTPDTLRQVVGTVTLPDAIAGGSADAGELAVAIPTLLPLGRSRRVAIVCPGAPEAWGWQSLATGIGGSEEAVIRLSRALSRRGHTVTVYGSGSVESDKGLHGTVDYKSIPEYTPHDILLAWRLPEALQSIRPFEAEWKCLWLHDSIPRERVAAVSHLVDCIWTISKFHADQYTGIPKVFVGRNGIDSHEMPVPSPDRNPAKIVYVSTPFRGLDTLLEYFPQIKARVPEAELHAYYGWEAADRMGATSTPEGAAFKQRVTELCQQPGVVWHGRVGQPELYQEVATAGVWAYPTRWQEENCISAYIAQACGAWPVVFPQGALSESVVFGWKVDPEKFVDSVVEAIRTTDGRERMMNWARTHLTWDEVASHFERLWKGLM